MQLPWQDELYFCIPPASRWKFHMREIQSRRDFIQFKTLISIMSSLVI